MWPDEGRIRHPPFPRGPSSREVAAWEDPQRPFRMTPRWPAPLPRLASLLCRALCQLPGREQVSPWSSPHFIT